MNKYIYLIVMIIALSSCGNDIQNMNKIQKGHDVKTFTYTTVDTKDTYIEKDENNNNLFKSTINKIFQKNKSVTCKYHHGDTTVFDGGVIYTDGKFLRYDISIKSSGVNIVIVQDGYSYSWNIDDKKGYKMKDLSTDDIEERNIEMNFICEPGIPKGIFLIPDDISFEEVENNM